jgi:cytochrome P450
MLTLQAISFAAKYWHAILLLVVFGFLAFQKFNKGLNKYPGPFLAAYTNWWKFADSCSRATHFTHVGLHRKHGDILRLGPNALSFADPKALSVIYGFNKGMTKRDFYPVQQPIAKGRRIHSLFSTKDEEYHAKYRRCVNGAFAMTTLRGYEPLVDSTTDAFVEQTLKHYCGSDKECNFYRWLQFYALDVIGELTWSKRMGFLENDQDVGSVCKSMAANLAYAGPIGQMPWIDLIWVKNPIRLRLQEWGWIKSVTLPTTRFALQQNEDRAGELAQIKRDGNLKGGSRKTHDFLSKFTQARKCVLRAWKQNADVMLEHDHPDFMDNGQVLATCNSMITAGTETTAITLSAIFHNLMRHTSVYRKLLAEIDCAAKDGIIIERRNRKVSWTEAQRLPYLDAGIQESFRLHPAVGMTKEKVVPAQGLEIAGHYIPGNTIVGCNPWVLQRRPEIFGGDVDAFRPERWLEASEDHLRGMRAAMFQFGGGSRTCIGKHIALFSIYKFVPTFLRNFNMQQIKEEDYRHQCVWMVRIEGFYAQLSERQ